MLFTVRSLGFANTDRVWADDSTLRATGRDGPAAAAEMVREIQNGQGFLLRGARGSGKTSLLNEVAFHFNSQGENVVAIGPLSLRQVAENGLDSLGAQLRDWLTRISYTLSSSDQPSNADSLDTWLPFLKSLIRQRHAETLLLLLDDLDSVPPEDREATLQAIRNSSWAKVATRTMLGCAESSREDEVSSGPDDECYADDRQPPSDALMVILKRETAIDFFTALTVSLGIVPAQIKAASIKGLAKGKGGGDLGDGTPKNDFASSGKPPRKFRGYGEPSGGGPPEAAIEEDVDATVYAPYQVAPGNSFQVLVYAHLPSQAATIEEDAKAAAPNVEKRVGDTLEKKITRGTKLTFNLTMEDLKIDEPSQSCIWQGKRKRIQFIVTVPENSKPRDLNGKVMVSENSVPIGHLKFQVKVAATTVAASTQAVVPVASLSRYKQAFISYASPDRSEVLKRVQGLRASKVSFFQDLLTLEPGDHWEKLIYQYIDQSDVFLLFWSKAASESHWVDKELEYAIARRAGSDQAAPEIVPIILESPPPKPPAELSDLHFNDYVMYLINAEEAAAKPAPEPSP